MVKRLFAISLLLLAGQLAAVSETRTFSAEASVIDKLVDVQADFSLESLLPGVEYVGSLRVDYAVPAASLRNINSPNVVVHARASGVKGDTWFYFRGLDGKSQKATGAVDFELECGVVDGACDPARSVLSATVPVYYMAPKGAFGGSDGVTVVAQLEDFQGEPPAIDFGSPQPSSPQSGQPGAPAGQQSQTANFGGQAGGVQGFASEIASLPEKAFGGVKQFIDEKTGAGGSPSEEKLAEGENAGNFLAEETRAAPVQTTEESVSDPLAGFAIAVTRNWLTSLLILAGIAAVVLIATKKRPDKENGSGGGRGL